MYSQNDWRSYTELYHKEGRWTWPNGNNSKEYNQWYYATHPEKWARDVAVDAIKKGGKWLYDKGKEAVEDFSNPKPREDGLIVTEQGYLIDPSWGEPTVKRTETYQIKPMVVESKPEDEGEKKRKRQEATDAFLDGLATFNTVVFGRKKGGRFNRLLLNR